MTFLNTVLYHRLDKTVHEPTEGNMWHADHITMYRSLRNAHDVPPWPQLPFPSCIRGFSIFGPVGPEMRLEGGE